MCHYIYRLFTCCSEPKEYDGVHVYDVAYCNNCPLSADSTMYNADFFHCPYVTAECLGDSDYLCPECSLSYAIQGDNDGLHRDGEPDDDFSEYDSDSDDDYFLPPVALH